MNSILQYFSTFYKGLRSLLIGMGTTLKIFFRKKTTDCYPENRGSLTISERFRGTLTMPHDAQNQHACVACGLCQLQCPNGSLRVLFASVESEDGKKSKVLTRYEYDLGSCLFCELCVRSCPHHAIEFSNQFDHAVYTRSKLVVQLNHPDSQLKK